MVNQESDFGLVSFPGLGSSESFEWVFSLKQHFQYYNWLFLNYDIYFI